MTVRISVPLSLVFFGALNLSAVVQDLEGL